MNRFKRNRYSIEKIVFINHQHQYIKSDDGTLYAGCNRTKILPQDLPEWYVYGRYYKRLGYMSTKGITDLLYVPNRYMNHFLKDDTLYIAYSGKITENPEPVRSGEYRNEYVGYDERVCGSEIISILKGAREHSDYDISGIIEQLREKKDWLIQKYPDEFGPHRWDFDVDKCFAKPFDNMLPPKYYALTLEDCFAPDFVSFTKRYYGTFEQIADFMDSLDYEKHKSTVDAFHSYLHGNTGVTHAVGQANCPLLEPVTLIREAFLFSVDEAWDFKNAWGYIYKMQAHSIQTSAILIKDGEQYIRCIRPAFEGLEYGSVVDDYATWRPVCNFWGHEGILTYDDQRRAKIKTELYLPEAKYDDVKLAVSELDTVSPKLDIVCEDIFGNG